MLWIIGAVLFAVWVLSLIFKVASGLVHIALLAALVFFVWGFVRGRTATPSP